VPVGCWGDAPRECHLEDAQRRYVCESQRLRDAPCCSSLRVVLLEVFWKNDVKRLCAEFEWLSIS
jgi:hypothetical protein